jgi:uncharacterized protein YjbI with pentapeptide repeats
MKNQKKKLEADGINASKMFDENIFEILTAHKLWLSSKGTQGSKAVFMHINFENFDFRQSNISEAIFKNCNLKGCKFQNIESEIEGTFFALCDLQDATFLSDLKNVKFEECNFQNVKMESIVFSNSEISKCFGGDSIFIKSFFQNSTFQSNKFSNADFNSAKIVNCNFKSNTALICDFAYTEITKTFFFKNVFNGSDFHSSKINSSKFESCELTSFKNGSDTIKTSLDFTKFINCVFKSCIFEETQASLKTKIVKNSRGVKAFQDTSQLKQFSNLAGFMCFAFLANITTLPFLKLSVLNFTLLSLPIFLTSSLLYTNLQNLKKYILENIKPNTQMKGLNFLTAFYLKGNKFANISLLIPPFILAYFWVNSFKLDNFFISFSLLCMLFCNSILAFLTIKKK